MEKMKPSKKEEDNNFTRLPEELFLSILRRITDDLKFLFQFSLVSKHFAATVNRVQTVSFSVPYMDMSSWELFVRILNSPREEIVTLIRSSPLQELKFYLFLQNFKELKSIHLEFIRNHTNNAADLAFHQWKGKCKASSGALNEKLVVVLATSVHACNAELQEAEREIPIECPPSHVETSIGLLEDCSWNWLPVLRLLLIKCWSSLECVTITDSKKVGKLVIRDEALVAWRKNLSCGESIDIIDEPRTMTKGWVQELRLPISRYVMKGVYFAVMGLFRSNVKSDEINTWECYDVMEWEFEREEKLLGEAVREILTNHRAILKDY